MAERRQIFSSFDNLQHKEENQSNWTCSHESLIDRGHEQLMFELTQSNNHVIMNPNQVVYKSSSLTILKAKNNGQYVSNDKKSQQTVTNAKRVVNFMHNMWRGSKMCDVTLHTIDDNLLAHKVTLGAFSELLTKKFLEDPPGMSTIDLGQCSTDIVKQILLFLYTMDITITESNMGEFIVCARQLGIDIIVDMCMDHMKSYNTSNALLYHSVAERWNISQLQHSIFMFICDNFVEISHSKPFLNMSIENLLQLLRDDRLLVMSELDVFLAMLRWVDYNRQERLCMVTDLLECVRLQLISPDMLITRVQIVKHVFNIKECYDQLYTAMW